MAQCPDDDDEPALDAGDAVALVTEALNLHDSRVSRFDRRLLWRGRSRWVGCGSVAIALGRRWHDRDAVRLVLRECSVVEFLRLTANGDDHDDVPADSKDDGHEDTRETDFEVLGTDFEFDISASVAFDGDTVTVRGTIQGTNTCYTAKLEEVTIENRTLLMNVQSFEDPDEGEVCGEAIIGIDYLVVIEFDGDPPTEVTVKHSGQHVTTEQSS